MTRSIHVFVCFGICCVAVAEDETPWHSPRAPLVEGIAEVALPGAVGSLCVFGPKSFPVVTAKHQDSTRLPILACAEAGAGRAVACAHGGFVEKDHGSNDTAKLMLRLVRWASRRPSGTIRFGFVRRHGLTRTLERDGHGAVKLSIGQFAKQLGDIDLLVLTGDEVTQERVKPIQRFLSRGGGLIVADAAWVWDGYRREPGDLLFRDHGPNRLLAPIGIVWTRGMSQRDAAGGAAVQGELPHEVHALSAIVRLKRKQLQTDKQIEQARASIEQGFGAIPPDDKLIYPWIDRIASQVGIARLKAGLASRRGLRQLDHRIVVGRDTVAASQADVGELTASPIADHFPAAVEEQAPRVDRIRTIDTSTPRWHCLGLYAAPGEVVTAEIDQTVADKGLLLRIGCHTDQLWHKQAWHRPPEITRIYPLKTTVTRVANAFGGLIYVEVPNQCRLGELQVKIGGAVDSPVYIHGQTTLAQWRSIRRLPGPWAEIGSDKIIFTVPSSRIRDLGRPDRVIDYWDEVMDACADLATIDHQRESPERFVIDVQISAGYMHAGYPIMAPSNLAGEVLDVETLQDKGNWGVFHEIGHNHQQPEWTFNGMGEVTVNLFSMYVYDTLHPGKHQHGQVETASIARHIADFERTGRREGPWVNLVPYIQLRNEFGWQNYKDVFATYRGLPSSQRPKDDLQKRDQWMVRFSKQVGRDLSPFFDYWKIETSEQAKRQIAHFPDWSGP